MENINTNNTTIWEEKNSTEVNQNCENNPILGQNDTTNEIKKKSVKHVWKIIGNKKKWIRKCPGCNKEIFYSYVQSISLATKNNCLCKICSYKNRIGVPLKEETKLKISKSMIGEKNHFYGKHHSDETKQKLSKLCGHEIREDIKEKFRKMYSGKGNPFYGKTHSEKVKNFLSENTKKCQTGRKKSIQERINLSKALKGKIRSLECKKKLSIIGKILFLERIEKLGILKIGYNPNACRYFDILNKQNGWNLQHALNGGERRILVYFLDAYDKERNIVVEYDEAYHNRLNQQKKDINRMIEIINYLKCRFFRYNEEKQILIEININDYINKSTTSSEFFE